MDSRRAAGLRVHFAASYLVPLDERSRGDFGGLLGWFWLWAYGEAGFLGSITVANGFPIAGFYLAALGGGLFLFAALAMAGWPPTGLPHRAPSPSRSAGSFRGRRQGASVGAFSMWKTPSGRSLAWLLAFLGASFAAAGLGTLFTLPALDGWYRGLRKPGWTPPDRLFGPVWTILYIQIAVSGWLVHRRTTRASRPPTTSRRLALLAWCAQLLLNIGWTAAFFGLRSPTTGLIAIAPLWAAIATTVVAAARVTAAAGLLLLPYLAWTTFAAALNLRIWQLNHDTVSRIR